MEGKPLVPKLRFPDFFDPWSFQTIGPYLEQCTSHVPADTVLPTFSSSRLGLMPQDEYYSGRKVMNEGKYGVVPPGAIVYRHMSDDGQFTFNLNDFGMPIAVSKEYPVFQTKGVETNFLLVKLNYSPDFKAFALAQKAGGTRTRLYFSKLRTWQTLLPSLEEQKKIAECLTSLDELIAAEGRKLEALRTHKKGLMQNLFPREGETVPRLRFPEFRDAGEWHLTTVGVQTQTFSGGTPDTRNPKYYGGSIPFIRSAEIAADVTELRLSVEGLKNSSAKMVEVGDVLLALYGANSGDCALARTAGAINQAILCLRPKGSKPYLHFFLTARKDWIIARYLQGGQGNLSADIVKAIPYPLPQLDEQRRIADCLTSLDALITAQAKKLDTLKLHKQGLMQGLFPSSEEAQAS